MFRTSIILKNAREDKDLSIAEVSKKLKISPRYLEAIESEDRSAFPSEPYCSLIIKDYATFLGLNGDDIISLFRRDFAVKQNDRPVAVSKFSLTPHTFFIIGLCLTLIIFVGYVVTEYLKYNQSPPLKVNWPEDSSLSLSSKIEISGSTDAEATVRINNDLIIVDQYGNFKKTIALSSPEQKVVVESLSHSGKTTSLEKIYHPK
jgi:cytoskeletal protein RodZ